MSNSPLVDVEILSPNRSVRTDKISKITIHHMAVVWSVEQCGLSFQNPNRSASSNYGIDSDGRVGLYVPEEFRSWASSSRWNDNMAVTIEVSNSVAGYPWPVSDKAYQKLIDLCVDICYRNGIKKLVYTGNSGGNLTKHNMFAATLCPGPYLEERFPAIADEVNKRLESGEIYDKKEDEDMTYETWCKYMERYMSEAVKSEPSPWAKAACEKAIQKGIMKGDGSGAYNFQKPLTREAYLVMQDREGLL